jgi:hypothetical protein
VALVELPLPAEEMTAALYGSREVLAASDLAPTGTCGDMRRWR